MRKYPGIPELIEQYMQQNEVDEQWITVHEFRDHFGLTRYQSNTVSAFLRRLHAGPFSRFPFIVAKIAQEAGENPSDPKKYRYLLKLRNCNTKQQKRTRLQDTIIREPINVSSTETMEHPA
jgi:hypothetical protein